MKNINKLTSFFLFIIIACAAFPFSAARAAGLCDGCPLQELCSDTTAGVEVLSCESNPASAAPPAVMDMAAALINEEAAAHDTAAVSIAASSTETVINSPFSMLTAYATTGEVSLILTIKGDGTAMETFIPRLTESLGLKNNAGNGCELLIATSAEITLKIDNGAAKEKFSVIESLGIKIEK